MSVVGGSSSAVERQLPKLDVAGSIPVSRSILFLFVFYRPFASSSRWPARLFGTSFGKTEPPHLPLLLKFAPNCKIVISITNGRDEGHLPANSPVAT